MLGKTGRAVKECTEFARYVKLRLDLESVFDTSQKGQAEMSTPESCCSLSPALVISYINVF